MSGQVAEQVAAPERGTPEYQAAMAEKYDNQGGVPPKPERPENVPEKFWDAEKGVVNFDAWSKSYGELEKKFSQGGQEVDPKVEEGSQESNQPNTDEKTAQEVVENAGLDWEEVTNHVNTTGQLTDEQRAALEKIGIPKHVVDGYLESVTIAVEAARNNTFAYVGGGDAEAGEAKLNAALEWASKNLSAEERSFYNQQLKSSTWKHAVDQLVARSGAAGPTGGEPQMLGGGEPAGSSGGFSSKNEMVKAMSDPRYKADPGYRNQVRQRVALSNF